MLKRYNNLKISARIIIGFFLIIAISCVIGIVGILNLSSVQTSYEGDYKSCMAGMESLEKISSKFQQIRVNVMAYGSIADTQEMKQYYQERLELHKGIIDENINTYYGLMGANLTDLNTETQLLENINKIIHEYEALTEQLMNQLDRGEITRDEFSAHFTKGGDALTLAQNTETVIRELIDYNVDYAANSIEHNDQQAFGSILTMIISLVVGAAIALVLSLMIARSISRPIGKVVEAARQLAKGDIDITFDIHSQDETGILIDAFSELVESTREQAHVVERVADGDLTVTVPIRSEKDLLGHKLNQMVESFNNLIVNISNAAEQVSVGAKQISDSSMSLSQGATEQASSIEELSATIEEISEKTKVNADNAGRANQVSEKAKNYALEGNSQMREMLDAMGQINDSSGNINRIIKVIEDIAFQTNILALNAAVEAARAGEHGKGFAVVAEEVRSLAAQSSNAAKETTVLIEDSIQKVTNGTKIAQETAEALEKIVEEVESVFDIVSGINHASEEQATAIAQINQSITQVSHVVQENSATSEESAAASEELYSQAENLKELIGQFRVKRNGAAHCGEPARMPEDSPEARQELSRPTENLAENLFGKY